MDSLHELLGWLVLRAMLLGPPALLLWLIRRDVRRDERQQPIPPPQGG